MCTSQNTVMAITGAMNNTIQERISATKSSVSPENSEACAGAAAASAARASKGAVGGLRMVAISVAGGDAELDLVEARRAGRFAEIQPVLLVGETQRECVRHIPAHAGTYVV